MPTRITERTGVFFARRTIDRDSVRYTPRVVGTDTTDVFFCSLSQSESVLLPRVVRRPSVVRALARSLRRAVPRRHRRRSRVSKTRGKSGGTSAHAREQKKKRVARVRSFFYMCIQYHRASGTPSSRAGRRHHKAVVRPIFFLFAGKHPWDISSLFSLSFYRYDHSVCVTCASRRPAEKKARKHTPSAATAHARTTPGISGFPIASPAQVSPGRSNGFREDFVMSEISDFEWRRPRTTTTTDDRRRRIDGGPATERTDEGSDGKD